MSFSFGFDGEDYSDDESLSKSTTQLTLDSSTDACKSIQEEVPSDPVASHSLAELLKSLPRSLSYSTVTLSDGTTIPRRELWDIKHQLMSGDATDDSDATGASVQEEEEKVLRFMGSDDVIKGIYEGGFKTWECSLDLMNHLATRPADHASPSTGTTVVLELGCGTAIPSVFTFSRALREGMPLKLIVQDYNLPVLQLSTIPNLFLAWYLRDDRRQLTDTETSDETCLEGEVRVTEQDALDFLRDLEERDVTIECFTGSWGPELSTLLPKADLILASETIYSTANLPVFTKVIKDSLQSNGVALVAAKCVYFGVGGGVEEFTTELKRQELTSEHVFSSKDGVRRTIMQVSRQ